MGCTEYTLSDQVNHYILYLLLQDLQHNLASPSPFAQSSSTPLPLEPLIPIPECYTGVCELALEESRHWLERADMPCLLQRSNQGDQLHLRFPANDDDLAAYLSSGHTLLSARSSHHVVEGARSRLGQVVNYLFDPDIPLRSIHVKPHLPWF